MSDLSNLDTRTLNITISQQERVGHIIAREYSASNTFNSERVRGHLKNLIILTPSVYSRFASFRM